MMRGGKLGPEISILPPWKGFVLHRPSPQEIPGVGICKDFFLELHNRSSNKPNLVLLFFLQNQTFVTLVTLTGAAKFASLILCVTLRNLSQSFALWLIM